MHILRKAFIFIVALLLFTSAALADEFSKSYIPCDCIGDCICFIQLGDEGNFVKYIINELIKQKYLPKNTPKGLFSPEVDNAVRKFQNDNDLEQTGMMDDDTLTLLLWGMTPNQLDKEKPHLRADQVFIPTDGGKKRHLSNTCSGMEDPRKVSIRNADKAGFDACKRKGCGDP